MSYRIDLAVLQPHSHWYHVQIEIDEMEVESWTEPALILAKANAKWRDQNPTMEYIYLVPLALTLVHPIALPPPPLKE